MAYPGKRERTAIAARKAAKARSQRSPHVQGYKPLASSYMVTSVASGYTQAHVAVKTCKRWSEK